MKEVLKKVLKGVQKENKLLMGFLIELRETSEENPEIISEGTPEEIAEDTPGEFYKGISGGIL